MSAREPNERPSTADIARDAAAQPGTTRDYADREVDLRHDVERDAPDERRAVRLLPDEVIADLRPRWSEIQASFVDEPRGAVAEADALVAEAIKLLAEGFAREKSALEQEWDRGDDVSTESLRVALQRYRAFFDRLLEV
jgi:hypothetical protein